MARLGVYVTRAYLQFYHYFGETELTWNGIHQQNRNSLLSMNIGADGLKTGRLAADGFGLVGSAVQGGHRLILILRGTRSEAQRASEARKLMEAGFHGPGP
jgi:serine-type D-Ala-D-Ala carboxypeptidase (penicillin-binding protein 5/6)